MMVPANFFGSAADNRNMLQMVFVAILAGIALVRMKRDLIPRLEPSAVGLLS